MRLLPVLLLVGCAKLQPATIADALCVSAGVASADLTVGPGVLPGVDLDLSACFPPVDGPLTCEEQAKVDQWVAWTSALAAEAAKQVDAVDFHLVVPPAYRAECPK